MALNLDASNSTEKCKQELTVRAAEVTQDAFFPSVRLSSALGTHLCLHILSHTYTHTNTHTGKHTYVHIQNKQVKMQ